MFRLALHILKIVVYVILVAGVLGFTMLVLCFVIYLIIEVTLFNNGGHAAYNWSLLFAFGCSLGVLWLLNKKRDSLKKNADKDGMLIWDISWNMVAISLSVLFIGLFWASVKEFINRDKDPRINSLSELLENIGELEGKTIKMSPELFDTAAISAELNNMAKNRTFLWKPFVSEEEGFSAEFPNYKILEKVEFIGTVEGRYKVKTYYAGVENALDFNRSYNISIVEIPNEYSALSFLEVVKTHLLQQKDGKLMSYEDYKGIGFIGKEMLISTNNGNEILTVRIIANKGRVYIIRVSAINENAGNKYLKYFFNSVQLL
jgi:hypothetical protein